MNRTIDLIDKFNEKIGNVVSWLSIFMVVVISLDVVFRYVFKFSFIWITELEIYFFGMLFLLASGYTFKHEQHVRVDVFYAKLSKKGQAWINLIGGVLFLLPWCIIVLMSSWEYAYRSFLFKETSPQPGGLPALYILKFCLVFGFFFLLVQGISSILKSVRTIFLSHKE